MAMNDTTAMTWTENHTINIATPITTQSTPVTSLMAAGELLATLNAEQQKVNVVVVGVLAVVILVGLLGNVLILAVYRPRPGGAAISPAILFILVMAGLDVTSCLFTVPYEILDLMMPYNNNNVQLCQAFRFLTTVLSQSRGLMLLCVALDRYFKICLPLTTYTCRQAKGAVVVVLIFGIAMAWPQIVLNGRVTISTHMPDVLGTACNIVHHLPAVYSVIYHGMMYVVFIIFIVAYSILYGRIFYVLWRKGWFEPSANLPRHGRLKEVAAAQSALSSSAKHPLRQIEELELCEIVNDDCNKSAETPLSERRCSNRDADARSAVSTCEGIPSCMKIICSSVSSPHEDDDTVSVNDMVTLDSWGFQKTESSTDGALEDEIPSSESHFTNDLCKSSIRHVVIKENMNRLSPKCTLKGDISRNEFACRFLNQGDLLNVGDSTESVRFSAQGVNYKEKHPRAMYRCKPVLLKTKGKGASVVKSGARNIDSSKPAGMRRSRSAPCSNATDTACATLPFLKHCPTCDVIMGNCTGSVVTGQETVVDALFHQDPKLRKKTLLHRKEASSSKTTGSVCGYSDVLSFDKENESMAVSTNLPFQQTVTTFGNNDTDNYAGGDYVEFLPKRPKTASCDSCDTCTDYLQFKLSCGSSLKRQILAFNPSLDGCDRLDSELVHSEDSLQSFPLCGDGACHSVANEISETSHCEMYGKLTELPLCQSSTDVLEPVCTGVLRTQGAADDSPSPNLEISRTRLKDLTLKRPDVGTKIARVGDHTAHSIANACHHRHEDKRRICGHDKTDFSKPHQKDVITTERMCEHGEMKPKRGGLQDLTKSFKSSNSGSGHGGATVAEDPANVVCRNHIRRHGGKRLRMGKTTLMLAMVTLSAVLGYVPFLTVIVMRTSGVKFADNTASTGDLVYMFCIRSYLINNIINPFVYFYVNPRFRKRVHRILRCFCQLLPRCKHRNTHSDESSPHSDS